MKRQAYQRALATAPSKLDLPRTPYAAEKQERQMGVSLLRRGGQHHIVRTIGGEGLAIVRNARSWSFQ